MINYPICNGKVEYKSKLHITQQDVKRVAI
ncbi:MAG: hypothetical protein ACJAWW_000815 [Sulfurimonas sp.]|jgi:hypothetical protein